MEWAHQYAEALTKAAGVEIALTPEEEEAVLLLARLVAHGSERRHAPLSTFLAGKFAGERAQRGVSGSQALAEAAAIAEDLLAARGGGGPGQPAT